jgi:hypothetical protein
MVEHRRREARRLFDGDLYGRLIGEGEEGAVGREPARHPEVRSCELVDAARRTVDCRCPHRSSSR